MKSIRNNVQLIGRLGKNPSVKMFNERKRAHFTMATSEYYRDKDGQRKEETQWHNVIVWGALSDVCEKYMQKGDEVGIEGRLTHRVYEHEGKKHYFTEVEVHEIVLFSSQRSDIDRAA